MGDVLSRQAARVAPGKAPSHAPPHPSRLPLARRSRSSRDVRVALCRQDDAWTAGAAVSTAWAGARDAGSPALCPSRTSPPGASSPVLVNLLGSCNCMQPPVPPYPPPCAAHTLRTVLTPHGPLRSWAVVPFGAGLAIAGDCGAIFVMDHGRRRSL